MIDRYVFLSFKRWTTVFVFGQTKWKGGLNSSGGRGGPESKTPLDEQFQPQRNLASFLEDKNLKSGLYWDEDTPLHAAADHGQLEVVKYLAQILPDHNPENAKGKTPLDMAKAKGHQEIVDFLETLINQSWRRITPCSNRTLNKSDCYSKQMLFID